MRASIYARISKDRVGAGLGVGTQKADCRDLAERLGHTVVDEYDDNDLSAYSGKPRPQYTRMLEDIAAGKIDVVLAWHTDRLHRSPAELEHYIAACEPRNVATVTVQAGPIDLSTPSGRMVARTLGNHARYEVEHAVERMKRAKQRSADAGKWKGGRRPFGYEPDGVTIREDEAVLIRSAADSILAGASVQSVARAWNAAGSTTTTGKPWALAAPRRILLRPRNAGLMEHQGEVVGAAEWPAILEPEKWRAVAGVLTNPGRRTNPGPSARKWLGSGIYRCGVCGTGLRATQRGDRRTMYRCTASHVARNQVTLDNLIEGLMVERLRRPDLAELLASEAQGTDVSAAEARAVELRERLNQLAGVFAAGGIDAQQLAAGTRALNEQLNTVREEIQGAYRGSALAGVADAPDPGAAWLDAPLDRRRAALDLLLSVKVNPTRNGRPKGWRPGEPYFDPTSVALTWKEHA
jgi:site-specific DNA recombinase